MEGLAQALSFLAVFVILGFFVAYLSVLAADNLQALKPDLPIGIRALRLRRRWAVPSLSMAIFDAIVVCILQAIPLAILASPSLEIALPTRIVALSFFLGEVAWFKYLGTYCK
jgi:uncharacterized membrane protein